MSTQFMDKNWVPVNNFFQAMAVLVLLCGCTNLIANDMRREKARWEQQKNARGCFKQIL